MTRLEELTDWVSSKPPKVVAQHIEQLETENNELKGRLAQDSHNSNRPPSSDGLGKRPRLGSLRKRLNKGKRKRKPGGQPGHPGRTLQQVPKADKEVVHPLNSCPCGECGGISLRGQPVKGHELRQVFELPPIKLFVTEHQAEIKICPVSGKEVRAAFPEGVNAPVQYGPRYKGYMTYMNKEQFLPFKRLAQLSEDLFDQPLSPGTIVAANQQAYDNLAEFEGKLVKGLIKAEVLHADETGIRVGKQLHWLHVACTKKATFYGVHRNRSNAAMDSFGILPHFKGWLVHDDLKQYMKYDCLHAKCNEHILRQLNFVAEVEKEAWAEKVIQFLLDQLDQSEQGPLDEKPFKKMLANYHDILKEGRLLHPRLARGQRRVKQSKAANLLNRLEDDDLSVLAFRFDPRVPFTNNAAEQVIRSAKVQQKISGCFRTLKGAKINARIKSYTSTCRKLGHNLWDAMQRAMIGKPFMPSTPNRGP
jgi:transposase